MGNDAFSFHLKGTSQEAVVAAYRAELPDSYAFVSRNVNGWVAVFAASWDPEDCTRLCRHCEVPGLCLALVDSDMFGYWVFDEMGNIRDSSDHLQSYGCSETTPTEEEYAGLTGDLNVVAEVFGDVDADDLQTALATKHTFREDNLWAFCKLLGIEMAGCTYQHNVDETEPEELEDFGEGPLFVHVEPIES